VAASKPALSEVEGPKASGMANAIKAIPKLRLRLPPNRRQTTNKLICDRVSVWQKRIHLQIRAKA